MQAVIETEEHIELVTPVTFEITREQIAEKCADYATLKADNPKGYEKVRLAIADFRNLRVGIEKRRKALKAGALEYGRMVDGAAKELTGLIEPTEEILVAEKQRVDDEKARVKREKEEAERRAIEEQLRAQREAEEAEAARLKAIEDARIRAEQDAERERLRVEREAFEAEQARIRAEQAEEDKRRAEARAIEEAELSKERERLRVEGEVVHAFAVGDDSTHTWTREFINSQMKPDGCWNAFFQRVLRFLNTGSVEFESVYDRMNAIPREGLDLSYDEESAKFGAEVEATFKAAAPGHLPDMINVDFDVDPPHRLMVGVPYPDGKGFITFPEGLDRLLLLELLARTPVQWRPTIKKESP